MKNFYFYFDKNKSALLDAACVRGNLGPNVSALLGDGSGDGRALHFALVVDDDAGVVLEVDEDTVLPAEWLALSDDDCGHYLLSQLRLALLHRRDKHVTTSGSWHSVKATLDTVDGNDEQVLGPSVVSAVHDCSDGQTERNAKLRSGGTTTTCRKVRLVFL